jgi:hypothetical protein
MTPTRERRAITALLNAYTRAEKHQDREQVLKTLARGKATANQWLNGTHPKISKARSTT